MTPESRTERIKRHIKKYQVPYSIGGTLIFSGVMCFIFRGVGGSGTANTSIVTRPFTLGIANRTNAITAVLRMGRGRPGDWVWCKELDQYFPSQTLAAAKTGVSRTNLSQHLNGMQSSVRSADGQILHFMRFAKET